MPAVENESMGRTARTAGLLYLIVVVTGYFSLAYVPSQTIVSGDVPATVGAIAASEGLFRLGIAASLVCYATFLLLPLVLYRLLSPVGRNAAVLMVALAVASVPISFVNQVNKLDVLSLVNNAGYLQAFTTEQLHAQVKVSLDAYSNGMLVTKVFWGLWLLPFGYLVFRSGFLPRVLGILLMLGCLGYQIDVFGDLLSPAVSNSVIARYARLPAAFGEIGTCLWLLILGVRAPRAMRAGTASR